MSKTDEPDKGCHTCNHCGADPDGAYCVAEPAMKRSQGFGLAIHAATHPDRGVCGSSRSWPFWEERKPRPPLDESLAANRKKWESPR